MTDTAAAPVTTFLLSPPGVYRPQSDTGALAAVIAAGGAARGRDVLDLGTGTGAVALAAARSGARSVTAVDLSRRAVAAARLNARLHRSRVRVHRGDLFGPVRGRRFGLITANPPYVPSRSDRLPRHRSSRSWDGGRDGRLLVDRICDGAAEHLDPGGVLLLVHGGACGADRTLERLAATGLSARVTMRTRVPLGPVMRARAALHEARGLVEPGAVDEELVVIEASRAC
ncbi:HemK2/MTQ2 family protein methyltransferase [Pseudonocardia sp. NPDC049635]|uniref:HemK2/MTQ2 family protein methyltransferase n=1 Tax=Pseudonocardia sp. NPDC049635 TaxID=3155506 RepID=UPI0034057F6B